jgi:hypothetical protein
MERMVEIIALKVCQCKVELMDKMVSDALIALGILQDICTVNVQSYNLKYT